MMITEQLVKLRKANNMSQDSVAEKLFVTRQTISKWETGASTPDLQQTIDLAAVFHVSLDELVLGKITLEDDDDEPINNVWEFLSNYWWAVIAIIGAFGTWFH